ncbi:OmpW family protein [Maricurvus nonylphenolicus]|uniref:OmpW/AlkL family protein n=1 Tax=Maricurvus nonylphenolicus TaxID=1008307 RepID=UPI0036F3BF7D
MKNMIKPLALASAVMAATTSAQVMALEAGDWIFRAGLTQVAPNEDTSIVTLNGADAFAGSELGVDNDTQLGINLEYMLTPNIGLELLAATPFEHTVTAKGALATALSTNGGTDVADIKHLPPTLSINYHFDGMGNFQPYVGLGINYTIFFSEDGSNELEATLASDTDVELDDSWGLSAQVGFDYHLNEKWLVNGSVRYIDIDTEADIKVKASGAKVESDVDIDPYVYTLSVGYKF